MEENSRPFWRQTHESFYDLFKLANKRIQREMTPLVSALLATSMASRRGSLQWFLAGIDVL